MKLIISYFNSKINHNLIKNFILNLDKYQEKELLVLLKNVIVKQINNIMLLNRLNKKKEKLILKKYKLDNKLKMNIILFSNMIFIIDNIKIMILLELKWKQLIQIQKILFINKLN